MKLNTATTLLCSIIGAAAASNDSDNAVPKTFHRHQPIQSRIVGGFPSAAGAYPFFTTVNSQEFLCGASLINSEFVMTAAHCEGAFDAGVRIGVQDMNNPSDGIVRQVVQKFKHPAYDDATVANDIMLLKLSEPVTDIQPVPFEQSQNAPSTGEILTVMGFGTTSSDGPESPILQQVDVNAVSDSICNEQYGGSIDSNVQFCAGVTGGGKDSCQGDSGGPILDASGTQVGIVSFGEGCGLATHSGVYTRVGAFSDWIQNTISQNSGTSSGGTGGGGSSGGGGSDGSGSGSGGNSGGGSSGGPMIGRLEITFDEFPEDTAWYLADEDTYELVMDGPNFFPYPYEQYEIDFDLQAGSNYEFILDDMMGDGFQGSFAIYAVDMSSGMKTLLAQGPSTSGDFFSDYHYFSAPTQFRSVGLRGLH